MLDMYIKNIKIISLMCIIQTMNPLVNLAYLYMAYLVSPLSGFGLKYLYCGTVLCNLFAKELVVSEEHPVSGGAEFPDQVLMSVAVRVRLN